MTTLLPRPAPRNPFSLHLPGLQLAWDSVSLKLLQECPRKYFYMMYPGQNWTSAGTGIHLDFGIAFHSAYEHFHWALFSGADWEEAVLAGTEECLSWDDTPHNLHKDYPYKNRHTLARSFVWHSEQYRDDTFKVLTIQDADGKSRPAVELSFTLDMGVEAPGGEHFYLCGHLDAAGTFGDELFFMDHKTTKSALSDSYFAQFNPNTQITNYFAASQVIFDRPAKGGIINAIQLLVNGTRFGRRQTTRSPDDMIEWERELVWWFRQAQRFAEEQFYPRNTNACSNFGGCVFIPICSKDPALRDVWLHGEFEKRIWNPLDTRGDL